MQNQYEKKLRLANELPISIPSWQKKLYFFDRLIRLTSVDMEMQQFSLFLKENVEIVIQIDWEN